MGKNLVIVESPAKAKTINKFLGKNFVVEASMGHVRDLPKRKLGIDVDENFEPQYQTIRGRGKILAKLRKLADRADTVYLAPDLDREGEAIAWHLIKALRLTPEKFKRITFNEITKKAILRAIDDAGEIDMDKVNAQQARRLLDRIVGYKLSPLLWEKLARGLSAGRVQSVAVRIIVDREKEIESFVSEEYWTIHADLKSGKAGFKALMHSLEGDTVRTTSRETTRSITSEDEAAAVLAELKGQDFTVTAVDKKRRNDNPPPPLTTSVLQQRCSTLYNFSAKKTMMLAQQLYEGVSLGHRGNIGLITYMRTDSVRLSDEAIEQMRKLVLEQFGKDFIPEKPNIFKSRKAAQEAHEAIRPSDASLTPDIVKEYLTTDQFKLYSLVWSRAVASQMAAAQIHNTSVNITCGNALFKAKGREILFPGYMSLIGSDERDSAGEILPELNEGQVLKLEDLKPEQHFTSPPPRYTEASLVRTMEAEGIGRPSTYAPTISTVQDRGYVKKKDRKFFATDLGRLVTELLVKHFPNIVDFKFTSEMEERLDSIEENGRDWTRVLREFYDPFMGEVDTAGKEMKNYKKEGTPTGEKCELCDSPMLLLWSRRGRFMGCSKFPDCRNAKPWREEGDEDESLDIKLDPCTECQAPMTVKEGRFGKFIGCTKYPTCKSTLPMPTGVDCPKDDCKGQLVARRSKKGRPFYGCNKYPDCDFITNRLDDVKKKAEEGKEEASEKKEPETTA